MDDRRAYWIGQVVTVVVAIAAVPIAVAVQDAPLPTILLRVLFFLTIGLSGIYLLRTWSERGDAASDSENAKIPLLKSAAAALLIAASGFGLWKTTTPGPEPTPPVRTAVHQLADQLTGKTWSEEQTSCATQNIKFYVEGDDLVAYPQGEPSLRYQLFGAHGQQLITRSGNSHVFFELRQDGFTLIESGEVQWFGLCS